MSDAILLKLCAKKSIDELAQYPPRGCQCRCSRYVAERILYCGETVSGGAACFDGGNRTDV